MLLAASGLTYTTATEVFAPQVTKQRDLLSFINSKTNKYSVNGNLLGDENAQLTVYIYTDYNCPFCGAYDIMFHKAAKELKGFKVIHKNLPLDMECNSHLKNPFHEGSCRMAQYAIAAGKQGKFWDMDSKLFELQPKNEDEIIEIARSIGLDIDKLSQDANSDEVKQQLLQEIDEAYKNNVDATPSMIVNGKVIVGIKPYSELKQILEDAGAKSR
jgi:protein-disulfide isomerase